MKKIYLLLYALLSVTLMQAQTFTQGDLTFTVTSGTNVAVKAANTSLTTATIPASVNNLGTTYAVTSLANNAFGLCADLTSISIPNSVTTIGDFAFNFCTGLTSVTLPNSVTSIGVNAFTFCSALTSVNIPDSVTTIGLGAFDSCVVLNNVVLPSSLTKIEEALFSGCWALTNVTIPDSVSSIGKSAFYACSSLTTISIPSTVTSIDEYAFSGCLALTSVTVQKPTPVTINANVFENITLANVTLNVPLTSRSLYKAANVWKDFNYPIIPTFTQGDLTYTPTSETTVSVKAANTTLTTATIPATVSNAGTNYDVTFIEENAFKTCTSLAIVSIPSSITSKGNNAFDGCTALTSVTVLNASPVTINASVFNGVTTANVTLNVPAGSRSAYKAANVWKGFKFPAITAFTIGDLTYTPTSETTASVKAANKTTLTTATIPANVTYEGENFSVTAIKDFAFDACLLLNSVTIPNSVTSIGEFAFFSCKVLNNVTIPNTVTTIGDSAFEFCKYLTNIIIPASVTSIGTYAFSDCTALTSITVLNSTPVTINANVFNGVTTANITLHVPAGSRSAYKAAAVWKDFKFPLPPSFTIGDLTYTPTSANTVSVKAANKTLTSATIPSTATNEGESFSVKTIEVDAFRDCNKMVSVTIPNTITSIADNAFYDCRVLASVTIPDSVVSIGSSAFYSCYSLASVTLPKDLTSIETYTFAYCFAIRSITIPKSVSSFGYNSFGYCGDIISITLLNSNPASVTEDAFTILDLSNVSLRVPAGSESIYRNAAVWKKFRLSHYDGNLAYTINSDNTISVRAFYPTIGPDITIPTTIVIGGVSYPVKGIEKNGFENTKNLVNVNLPLLLIGENAFKNSGLKKIAFNATPVIRNYSKYSSANKTATSVVDPLIIGNSAFADCTNLESFEFPENTSSIGDFAFQNCTALTAVNALPTTPLNINANVFDGVTIANIPLTVAAGSENLYKNAPVWQNFKSVSTLGTSEFEMQENVLVYPNPSTGIFTIDLKEDATVEVNDLLGKVIYVNKLKVGINTMDISNYQTGIYVLNVKTENGTVTKKIVKQ